MPEFIKSKVLMWILAGLAGIAVLAGVFQLGVSLGERKALHFNRWSENYGRNFGPRGMLEPGFSREMMRAPQPFGGPMLPGSHGIFGKVLSTDGVSFVVQGQDSVEQSILVTSSTAIRSGNSEAKISDIKAEQSVSVFGRPNDQGQIEAKLIRLLEGQAK